MDEGDDRSEPALLQQERSSGGESRVISERLPDTDQLNAEFAMVRNHILSLQGSRPMPRRVDFDPTPLRSLLPRLQLISVIDGGQDFLIRVAGGDYRKLYGFEATRSLVSQWQPPDYRDHVLSELRDLVRVRRMAHRRLSMTNANGERRTVAVIRFPMSDDGELVDHILTVLRFVGQQS